MTSFVGAMLAWLVLIGAAGTERAAAGPGGEPVRLQVRRLVRQLDAPSLEARQQAERELTGLGPAALEFLREDDPRWSAEVRQRVGRIREALQRQLAERTIQPSTVTLQSPGMPVEAILAALEGQTGNRIVLGPELAGEPEATRKVAVDFSKTPFWEALDRVLDDAGLAAEVFGPEKAVFVRVAAEGEAPRGRRAVYCGPFRLEPVRVEAVRDLRRPSQRALRVAVEVAWEPRLDPISLQQPRDSIEAFDDGGHRLAAPSGLARPEIPVMPTTMATEVPIPLTLPARQAEKIARLEGRFAVLVPGRVEAFRFQQLEGARNVERRIAATTVTLQRVRKNGDLWELLVAVRFQQTGDALASHYNWILDNEACLEAAGGKRLDPVALNTTRRTDTEISFSYLFAVDGPLTDWSFVYRTPVAIYTRQFEFRMDDIPLP